ncbi:MAG: phosphodiester glycosidase family protein [Syntrophales bacterium]|nr:phosphodiester glycosidase family protein [Syntrophales bacterium]
MRAYTKRYNNTTCHIVTFSPYEMRLEPHNGIPGKRESIHNMWGSPGLSEVTCLKANGTFFNNADPSSEMLGSGRGDSLLNVAWDGQRFYMEPNIPKGMKEVSSSYALVRNGKKDYTNEKSLIEILGSNPRMIMGQKNDGQMSFVAVEGRRWGEKGLTSEEERDVCIVEGFRDAVNNDGGGSTVLIVEDQQLNRAHDGRSLGYIWVGYRKWRKEELPNLRKGIKGMWVNLLQRMLGITADGSFGEYTEKAVRRHQEAYNLKVDGRVGPHTWASLCALNKV